MAKSQHHRTISKKLSDIIFEIQQQIQGFQWFLSYDRLAELLGYRKEECLKKIYHFRLQHPQMSLSGGFHEVDGDYLIDFLSLQLREDDVAEGFLQGGIFFSERPLYELRESYKSLVQKTIAGHKLDKELLLLLVASTIDFDDALDSYLMDKFEIEFFVKRSIDQFLELKGISAEFGADEFLLDYLNALLPTKILNFRDITQEFRERSFYEVYGRTRTQKQKKTKRKSIDQELEELLIFFDLDENSSAEDLKKSFKIMIKKYHPDLNKQGEEMTKKIIQKYNRLMEMFLDR